MIDIYIGGSSDLLDGNPTIGEAAAGAGASNDAAFTIMHAQQLDFVSAGPGPQSIYANLHWKTLTSGGGGGSTKWMISTATTETEGAAPTGSAVDITASKINLGPQLLHRDSGRLPVAKVPTVSKFWVLLVGKPDIPAGTLTASILDECRLQIAA